MAISYGFYDAEDEESILRHAMRLVGGTLREHCHLSIRHSHEKAKVKSGDKGGFGGVLERHYFGYSRNSRAEADFSSVRLELKSSAVEWRRDGSLRAKERISLGMIDYFSVADEDFFESSSVLSKNRRLLLVFHENDATKHLLDRPIILVGKWEFPAEDLKIIKCDWEFIRDKVRAGEAHLLSEGDTWLLGAATKGAKGMPDRKQPFSEHLAKRRAFALKQGYVDDILFSLTRGGPTTLGKEFKREGLLQDYVGFEGRILELFRPFVGKSVESIAGELKLSANPKELSLRARITSVILGVQFNMNTKGIEWGDTVIKTISCDGKGMPHEHVSFPVFSFEELIDEDWLESSLRELLESRFLFVIYRGKGLSAVLERALFCRVPQQAIEKAREEWETTRNLIRSGKIVKEIKVLRNGSVKRLTFFTDASKTAVVHVRPHAQNAEDSNTLPVKDKLTGLSAFTKQSFWLNRKFIYQTYLK